MLQQSVFINSVPPQSVYDVLMDSKEHSKLIGDEAHIDPTVGGKFETFGGYADGKNLTLASGKMIKQTWRASDWPKGHYSTITFEFNGKDGGTEIKFTQEDLPEGTIQEFESGWDDFYWSPLKNFFS